MFPNPLYKYRLYSVKNLVWFGQLLGLTKKTYFLGQIKKKIFKICYSRKFKAIAKNLSKIQSYWKKCLSYYKLHTLGMPRAKFRLIWTTPWSDKKYFFKKFVIFENCKFPYENLTPFLGELLQIFFTLYLHRVHSVPFSDWFGPLLDLIKNKYLCLKFVIFENCKFQYENLTFFLFIYRLLSVSHAVWLLHPVKLLLDL